MKFTARLGIHGFALFVVALAMVADIMWDIGILYTAIFIASLFFGLRIKIAEDKE